MPSSQTNDAHDTLPTVRHREPPTAILLSPTAPGPEDARTVLDPRFTQRAIVDLKPYDRNARTHSAHQIAQIAASLEHFGFVNPVLIDGSDRIVAGHGRVAAAKTLGMTQVPTLLLQHLSEAELRAYRITDNRLAELARWDETILAIELQHLVEIEFEVELTGFATAEIDLIIEKTNTTANSDPADGFGTETVSGPAVTQPGDLWELGTHRLLCGDALARESYARLLGDEKVRVVFTDPPYNVRINGHVSGLGRVQHREFAMAAGEMSEEAFTDFLARSLEGAAKVCVDGAILFVCMDWRHLLELFTAARRVHLAHLNLCVWNKNNAGMGSFYRSKHELVAVFKAGAAGHVNNIQLGRHGRYRTNVWDYPGVNTWRPGREAELAMHPTVKPVALVADALRDCSRRRDLVLDPFAGSGTILIAAERTGRQARVIELDPFYVDVAVRRWQCVTGKAAILAGTGRCFAAVAEERATAGVVKPNPVPSTSTPGGTRA